MIKVEDKRGFTIIEVLIVLVIAAVILLIVLLAVPTLARYTRNHGRKSEVQRIAAAIIANEGAPPNSPQTSTWMSSDCQNILDQSADLVYFSNLTCQTYIGQNYPLIGGFTLEYVTTSTNIGFSNPNEDTLLLMTNPQGYRCNNFGSGPVAVDTFSYRYKMALFYTLEIPDGLFEWHCLSIE